METKPQGKSLFQEFLELFEQVPADISAALLKVTTDEDEKNIINSFLPVLNNQFRELAAYTRNAHARSTLQHQQETETFLQLTSGVTVAKNLRLALPSIGSVIGKFGITEIVHTLKKLIEALFKEIPGWLDKLFLIIDEILNMLFGGTSMKMKNMLSQAEQNFLAERRQRTLLEKARENGSGRDDDDDE